MSVGEKVADEEGGRGDIRSVEEGGEEEEWMRWLHLSSPCLSGLDQLEVGIGKGLVAADNLHDKVYGYDIGNVCGIWGTTTSEDTDNLSCTIDNNRPGITFGGKSTRQLVEGQNHQLLGN